MANPNYGGADRTNSLHRSFTALRSALRSIIFHNGDCTRYDEPRHDDAPCECAVCIAKAALQGEEDWRFDGYNPQRRKTSPREAAIHSAWVHFFKHAAGNADGTSMPMDATLAMILFGEDAGPNAVTERDWYVATTIVQWLATNVGQAVLFDGGYENKIGARDPILARVELVLATQRVTLLEGALLRACDELEGTSDVDHRRHVADTIRKTTRLPR